MRLVHEIFFLDICNNSKRPVKSPTQRRVGEEEKKNRSTNHLWLFWSIFFVPLGPMRQLSYAPIFASHTIRARRQWKLGPSRSSSPLTKPGTDFKRALFYKWRRIRLINHRWCIYKYQCKKPSRWLCGNKRISKNQLLTSEDPLYFYARLTGEIRITARENRELKFMTTWLFFFWLTIGFLFQPMRLRRKSFPFAVMSGYY